MLRVASLGLATLLVGAGSVAAAPPVIVGGTTKQQRVLAELLAGMPNTRISTIVIRAGTNPKAMAPPGTVLIKLHARAQQTLQTVWEEWLLGGAFRELSLRDGLPRVAAVATDDDASRVPDLADRSTNPQPSARLPFARSVAAAIQTSGARLERLTILTVGGFAPAAYFEADDPAAFLKDRLMPLERRLNELTAAGWYLELDDATGRRAWAGRNVPAAGTGGRWVRPDLEGCDPPWSYPAGYVAPPCPA